MSTHRVDIVFGASEGYTAREVKFMSKPAHISGETLMVDVATPDLDRLQSFGPFAWVDATLYAEHAQGKDSFEEAVAFLADIEKRHEAARYPGNDWTGLLAPLQRA